MRLQLGAAILFILPHLAYAQSPSGCEQTSFASTISEAGALLSVMNEDNKKLFQAKLAALRMREGWADSDYSAKATPFVKDAIIATLDEGNKVLLEKVPQLGSASGSEPAQGPDGAAKRCVMLEELRALMNRVVENTRAKWAHMQGKLDAALDTSRQAKAAVGQ